MKQKPQVFENASYLTDDEYLVKQFLNSMYEQGRFVRVIDGMVNKDNIVVNDECCLFPDWESAEPILHFDGVKFNSFDQELILSEAACSAHIDQACEHYLRLHPEDTAGITAILAKRLF